MGGGFGPADDRKSQGVLNTFLSAVQPSRTRIVSQWHRPVNEAKPEGPVGGWLGESLCRAVDIRGEQASPYKALNAL